MGITLAWQPSEIVWRTLNQWAEIILWSIICVPILEELIFRRVLYLKLSEIVSYVNIYIGNYLHINLFNYITS